MDWIFDNLQIVVVIAAAIATLVTRAKQAHEEKEISENMPPAIPVDPDAELRRIREEVARRRAEREGRPVQPVSDEGPPPLLQDDTEQEEPRTWNEPPRAPVPVPPPVYAPSVQTVNREREEEVLERQRALTEKLRQLREQREAVASAARSSSAGTVAAAYSTRPRQQLPDLPFSPATLASDLRKKGEIRRAILMSEILGRPKGA